MEFYLTYLAWIPFVTFGSLVDARLWNKKEADPLWLRKNFDYFWLFAFPAMVFINVTIGWYAQGYWDSYLMFLLHNALVAFGSSVIWDLIYSKIEHGSFIVPLPIWLTIPYFWKRSRDEWTDRIVIGFTRNGMITFNSIRIAVLILSLFIK